MAHGDGIRRVRSHAHDDRTVAEIARLAGVHERYARRVLVELDLPWKRERRDEKQLHSRDDSWWGRQEPFTGRVIRSDRDQIVAREMRSGWWRIETWPGRTKFVGSFEQARLETSKTGRA